jgi:hypothetical protein
MVQDDNKSKSEILKRVQNDRDNDDGIDKESMESDGKN